MDEIIEECIQGLDGPREKQVKRRAERTERARTLEVPQDDFLAKPCADVGRFLACPCCPAPLSTVTGAAAVARSPKTDVPVTNRGSSSGPPACLPRTPVAAVKESPAEERRGVTNRGRMKSMGPLSDPRALLPLEVVFPEGPLMMAKGEQPRYTELEVVLDSGAGAHVASKRHVTGYEIKESALSRAGAAFVAADGGRMKNHGETSLSIVTVDSKGTGHAVTANFQIADVTRALWSVGLICDSGLKVTFRAKDASVLDANGIELCHFERVHGLYVAKVQVENPLFDGFHRQGR